MNQNEQSKDSDKQDQDLKHFSYGPIKTGHQSYRLDKELSQYEGKQ